MRSYGMKVVDYFPYLMLGIAYHHLGQQEAALEAFDTEERLGVVQGSPLASEQLRRYRQLALDARRATAAAGEGRAAELVATSLEEARGLGRQGKLDEAMAAVGRALAVAPDHPGANELMAGLRTQVAARDRRRQEDAAAAGMLADARAHLAGGRPQQAAGLLRQVLATRPSEEARQLLARAQEAILATVAAEERASRIAQALAEARRLLNAGRLVEAAGPLELVLALDPTHAEAAAMRARLVAAQGASRDQELVAEALSAAGSHLSAGRFEKALSAANRVLAVERSHPGALEIVRRAYTEISRRLLAPGAAANVPPAIRFADLRQGTGGDRAERVGDPEFRFTGVAIDSSRVAIAVREGGRGSVEVRSSGQPVGALYVTEFSVRQRLSPGRTAFEVIATDDGGLAARSEYAVIYRRPWFRSPWLWTIGGAIPALLLGGVLLRARRRRRQRLQRRFNPYVAGGPVFSPELFFGREALLQRLLQTIHTNSLLLHGERRIGKTSILHQLRRRLEALDDPEYRFHPVYVDLQGTPEARFFATLADQIFDTVGPLAGVAGRQPALDREGYSHHDLVRELDALLRVLQERSDKKIKLVLLVDEVDELNRYDPRVNQKLRSLFMKRFAESLVAVVAGVSIRKEWEHETSPWYNFFEEVAVEPIALEQARELVRQPIRGTFRLAPGVAERIATGCGGRPYRIQRRCLALVNRLHEEGRRTITLADVEAVERSEGA